MAWGGLQDTVTWALLDEDEKETYLNILENDITGFEILSVGEKCD